MRGRGTSDVEPAIPPSLDDVAGCRPYERGAEARRARISPRAAELLISRAMRAELADRS
jgi:hypothetical protein